MVKRELVHPDILGALARAGHGSRILIADGDYPVATTRGRNAAVVHLNLSPGVVGALEVLSALLATVVVESAVVMDAPDGDPPPSIWGDFKASLELNGCGVPLKPVERFSFYQQASEPETALVIQTGEKREYANLLLTIGSLW
jgi:L-fucose mutarotase